MRPPLTPIPVSADELAEALTWWPSAQAARDEWDDHLPKCSSCAHADDQLAKDFIRRLCSVGRLIIAAGWAIDANGNWEFRR